MSFDQDVVITGMGAVTPIGIGIDEYWQGLCSGRSGVRIRSDLAHTEFPIRLAAPVTNFDAKLYIKPRKAIKIMCQPIQFACAAAAMAVDHAKLPISDTPADRIGIVFGAETFYSNPLEVSLAFQDCISDEQFHYEKWDVEAIRKIQPLWMLKYLPNMAGSHISIALNATGHSNTICQGESSGSFALMEAVTVIQRGLCDVVVAGATSSLVELTSVLYRCKRKLSQRYDEPAKACRPFDKDRDGVVVGEGAGALLLETAEHAAKRGVKPIAKISGWSRSYYDPDRPDFHTAIASGFRTALQSASMVPADITAVNANANGSLTEDIPEAIAINEVFGEVPVVALKAHFGDLGPGTSTVELIGALLAIEHGRLPAALNCDNVDPACPVNLPSEAIELSPRSSILKSSISSTGQITSLILTGC